MRGYSLSASLMCARLEQLGEEVRRLEAAGIDAFHFDVMDGHFVPALALSLDILRALRPLTRLPCHVHAMVDRPEAFVDQAAEAGCDLFIFHWEASDAPARLSRRIGRIGMRPGVAINPATPADVIARLPEVDHVQVMTVEPGFAGGAWVPSSVERVGMVRDSYGDGVEVGVDGHIDTQTGPLLRRAGADVFVCGSAGLFGGSADYAARLTQLRRAIDAESPTGAGTQ